MHSKKYFYRLDRPKFLHFIFRGEQTEARLSSSDCAYVAEERLRDLNDPDSAPLSTRPEIRTEYAVAVEWMEAAYQ